VGLLTSDQRSAIVAGAPVRQAWTIHVPVDYSHTGYQAVVIHDYPWANDTGRRRVVDAGKRKFAACNYSPQDKSKLTVPAYEFEVDNGDGWFHPLQVDCAFTGPAGYQAHPAECLVVHQVLIKVGGSYQALPCKFTGQIEGIRYRGAADAGRASTGDTAIIKAVPRGLPDVLQHVWNRDDAYDDALTGITWAE